MASNLSRRLAQNLKSDNPFRELSMFFNKDGPIWLTIRSLVKSLEDQKVNYAVIGGLAVYAHGYERTTHDCDILLSRADYEKFMAKLVNFGLKPKFEGRKKKFVFTSTGVSVDVAIEGEYPGGGSIGPISFPNPKVCQQNIDDMKVISLPKLIDLKLASHQYRPVDRAKDFSDVVELIKILKLNQLFSNLLDPAVRNKFEQILLGLEEEKQRMSDNDE
ncbi:unnamed protein product [Rotaria sordida]|uniref:Uncharacterized protein n=1 Tax=Rotaria sordida TaxID=392033 RepID=A0A814DLY0_9BILA|nr:unnamed protein product [Rotaria sordida]CAF0954688.1 unnamed protein product [Rotaria sordida]